MRGDAFGDGMTGDAGFMLAFLKRIHRQHLGGRMLQSVRETNRPLESTTVQVIEMASTQVSRVVRQGTERPA